MKPTTSGLVRVLPGLTTRDNVVFEEVELPAVRRVEAVYKRRRGIVQDNRVAPRVTVNPRKD